MPRFAADSSTPPLVPSYWCRTIGGLTLATDARRILAEAGKPLALLARLGLAPRQRADRDYLASLLWSEASPADARHSLRQAIYRLKQFGDGADLVTTDGSELVLSPHVEVDCVAAERIAASDRERAYETLRGVFLDGVTFPDAREFERWAEEERGRLTRLRTEVGLQLAERRLAEGHPHLALDLAEELAALHPFDEAPIRLSLTASAALGRHASAVARFHAWADLARRELEVEISPELERCVAELQAYVVRRPEPLVAHLPFVGRAAQWAALEAAWHHAEGGTGSAVLLEGAAGLGKTRLLEEFTRRIGAGRSLVLRAKCSEVEREVPYGVLAEALVGLTDRPELAGLSPAWLAEAARLLPELHDRFTALPPPSDPHGSQAMKRRLHQALVRCVEVVAEETTVALLLDDIHWADGPSLAVLHLLLQQAPTRRLLLVATYRPADLSPVARQFARTLVGEQRTRLLPLEPLGQGEVDALMAARGRFNDPATRDTVVSHLARQSSGNPLLLGEMLDALGRSRVLMCEDGRWVLGPEARLEQLPRTLTRLMSDRVERLDPWMRACVETLAVAGQALGTEALARALDLSEPRLDLALAVLAEERLVRQVGSGLVDLVHDELRRLVYQGIPDDRRRLLHLAVGLALEAGGEAKRPGGGARLANQFDRAGDRERAHRYALRAAGEADALAAPEAQAAALELADAHAPRALPPGRPSQAAPSRRWLVPGLTAVALAAGSLLVGALLLRRSGAFPFAQGEIYLAEDPVAAGATHRLAWPTWYRWSTQVVPLHDAAPLGPHVLRLNVRSGTERHNKLALVTERDTVQLTDGPSDDGALEWLPDRRELLTSRGARDSIGWFRANLHLVNPRTRTSRRLTTTRYQDQHAAWSPTGTSFVVCRDSQAVTTVWRYDADGRNPEDLTRRFDLPQSGCLVSYSPEGDRLALVPASAGGPGPIRVVDLLRNQSFQVGGPAMPEAARWSPDGRWLAYVAPEGDRRVLTVVPVANDAPPVAVLELSPTQLLMGWGPKPRRSVDAVLIRSVPRIAVGEGVRLSALVRDARGDSLALLLRWSVTDSAAASVDHRGFLRGLRPGALQLVASAGGYRADTVALVVAPGMLDTLFQEDWSGGLDSTRWIAFGDPLPRVIQDPAAGQRPALFNNGDFNHSSGVASRAAFEVGHGITILTSAWLPFTGEFYQNWGAGARPSQAAITDESMPLGLTVYGPDPVQSTAPYCNKRKPTIAAGLLGPGWRQVAVQFRPDGRFECWVEGHLVGEEEIPAAAIGVPLRVMLQGRSVGTRLLHGPVLVLRGLKY